jgi:3-dehydroquinate synthetase
VLRPLLETEHADELIDKGAYTPPKQVMTDPKWNFAKLNLFRKYGDAIAEIIERGTLRESPTLQIKEKNKSKK